MHNYLLLPRKLASLSPKLSKQCIPSSMHFQLKMIEEVIHINEIQHCSESFSLSLPKQFPHNWHGNIELERTYTLDSKRLVLPLHTTLLFLLGTPTMMKLVMFAM